MKNPKASLFGTNLFAKAFAEFDEESFFQNLHNKVKNKSYFEKYKGFKNTLLGLSYLFNAASIFSASYGVFWLTKWFTGTAIAGYVLAAVFLFFLEKLKRKSSNEFFQVWFFRRQTAIGWLCLSLACLGISLGSSSFGTKTGTEELAPDPELIATDSTAAAYRAKIAELELKNQQFSNQTNHEGTIYYKLQNAIRDNTSMIAEYNTRVLELDKKLEGKNEQLTATYQESVQMTKHTLITITILFEILFEACICYIWYYFHRSYVERTRTQNLPNAEANHLKLPPSHGSNSSASQEELLDLVYQLQQQVNELNSRHLGSEFPVHQKGKSEHDEDTNGMHSRMHRVYGFLTNEQKRAANHEGLREKLSEQALADLSRQDSVQFEDRFTIVHRYLKGNQEMEVRYTLPRIESRLAQYNRELNDAIEKNMGEAVIENRKNWIAYWESRKEELKQKMDAPLVEV